jgi:alkylation response protein AidB-like acyl-CoA dehydrogenase
MDDVVPETSTPAWQPTLDRLVAALAETAVERDRRGGTALRERAIIRDSGLLRLSIPRAFGGCGASWAQTLAAVEQLARVDSSLAHVFAFHHLMLATTRLFGTSAQWQRVADETARHGWFWGNALNPLDPRTTLHTIGDGGSGGKRILRGQKSFCSGARDSDRLIVSALDEGSGKLLVAAIPTARAGVVTLDDWDNMGQRQTDSGSVEFHEVVVEEDELLRTPGPMGSVFASLRPCLAQLILTHIYLGLGQGALAEARRYTRSAARAWPAANVERPVDDPYIQLHYGEFFVELEGARALTERAAAAFDRAYDRGEALGSDERAATALAIAAAKVASARAGLDVTQRMFEVMGARATTAKAGIDRYWRNLRTHTLHDPIDYKLRELGRFALDDVLPTPGFYS